MSEAKCNLSNALIEGFLFEILDEWKDVDTIIKMLHERFGDDVCVPSDLSKSGEPRYIAKIKKTLERGVRNNIYIFDEGKQCYKNNS